MENNVVYPLDTYWSILPESLDKILNWRVMPKAGPVEDLGRESQDVSMWNGIAVIKVRGIIQKRKSFLDAFFSIASTNEITNAVKAAAMDTDANKILFLIDSPGGSVDGLAQLGDTIREVREKKRVIAYVDGMAASAAYYIASQADKVYAGRTDVIGSIGTILALYDYSEAFAKAGIKPVIIASGEHKSTGVPGVEVTESQKAEMQKLVDFYFDDFVTAVSRGRGMPKSQIMPIADGRVFNAPEAKEKGLIDGIKTQDEVLTMMTSTPRASRVRAEMIGR